MAIFYTIGNKNLSTVKLVAKSVKNVVQQNITKIIIFNTPTSHILLLEQESIYRKYFGQVPIQEIMMPENGVVKNQDFYDAFNCDDEKVVDLTNGQKTTATLLYVISILIKLQNIYYLYLKVSPNVLEDKSVYGRDYEYIKLPNINKNHILREIGCYDLIYYIGELDSVFELEEDGFFKRTKKDLKTGIMEYFKDKFNRSSISNAATFYEMICASLISLLKEYKPAIFICNKYNVEFGKRDPIGVITYFFKNYIKENLNDETLEPLVTLAPLLSAVRGYRNLSAHSANLSHEFQLHESRIVLNMSIEILRICKESKMFWNKLQKLK